ncbi:hypothetical protein [Terrabacter terrae]|uniref:hypothetical protein n=1 Tax=Terrabacter terrae TaxID=318434 RepID=UPI0031DDFA64
MSNPRGKPPSDTEAIAFAVIGQVLGVHVDHADADGTPGSVDGRWTYPDGRRAALEVTAPEASKEIGERVRAERQGQRVMLNGTVELGNLAEQVSSVLAEPWAAPNIRKTGGDRRSRNASVSLGARETGRFPVFDSGRTPAFFATGSA